MREYTYQIASITKFDKHYNASLKIIWKASCLFNTHLKFRMQIHFADNMESIIFKLSFKNLMHPRLDPFRDYKNNMIKDQDGNGKKRRVMWK